MYKYEIVATAIKEEILSGKRKPGEKLPSIQKLSQELGYNADTIIKAYHLLEDSHHIYSAPQSGYYVVKSARVTKSNNNIDMITVKPPDKIHPYKDFYHCMEKAISIYENKLFEYDEAIGLKELRQTLVKYLMDFQVFTGADNVFITNGAQQALYILSGMSFPNQGNKVLVEQPTYSLMLQVLNCNQVPVLGIKRDVDGIDLHKLEELFQKGDIKFFYCMPRYQNPMGFCYNNSQKAEIVRLAKKYYIFLVEDDYLADLELDKKADPMYALGDKDIMIYIRSFSKTLLPGLRLGAAILPDELKEGFLKIKTSMDLNTPVLTQGALEIYLKSKMYQMHREKVKAYYKEKMEVLKKACKKELGDKVRYHISKTGLYASIEFSEQKAGDLIKKLSREGIMVTGLQSSFLEGFEAINGIRLCICSASDEEIKRTVSIIKQELT